MGKIIINLLLLCSTLSSCCQEALFHAHNQTPTSGVLDTYSGAEMAFSVRKVRTAYAGSCMRVRRSTDNAETDIGFTAAGDLDEGALTTFAGAASAFVTTWYDQSGNGKNATQTTAANQPRIVNAGTVDKKGGRPALYFNRTASNFLTTPAVTSQVGTTGVSVFQAVHILGTDGNVDRQGVFYNSFFEIGRISTVSWGFQAVPNYTAVVTTSPSQASYVTSIASLTANTSYVTYGNWAGNVTPVRGSRNGTDLTSSASSGSNMRTGITSMAYYTGYSFEAIIYLNSTHHGNRAALMSNINSYYTIY